MRYVNFERTPDLVPKLDGYHGIILLGGYMGVYEQDSYSHLRVELRLIEEALRRELPILGICLGSQILASVLGANVRRHKAREMGWYDIELTEAGAEDPVIGHFRKPAQKVFQSHGDVFDVPASATHLARSALCEGQAFRYGKNAGQERLDRLAPFRPHRLDQSGHVVDEPLGVLEPPGADAETLESAPGFVPLVED